jgi:predicted amidohydrolase
MYLKRSRIALAQTNSVLGDIERNVSMHCDRAAKAAASGADAIIFPELSLTGYTLRDINFDVALDASSDKRLDPLRKLSKDITIICGGVERTPSGGVYNTAFTFEGGKLIHGHHKVYPPTYGIFEEERYFLQGTSAEAFDSEKLGRIGILVCEDLWHPSLPYLTAHQGAQMIITIAASPTRLGVGDHSESDMPSNYIINRDHHIAYARLHGVYMVFVNRVGVEDGVNFWGGSEVVAPDGTVISNAGFFDEEILYVDIDPKAVRHAREYSRHMLDENLLLTHKILGEIVFGPKGGENR